MTDVECQDCGNTMVDVPERHAHDGTPCDVCGSQQTRVLR